VSRIAKWDGSTWSPLGSGLGFHPFTTVYALAAMPDGDIVAGGSFSTAGGNVSVSWARWGCESCYANCDGSASSPTLTANDFQCFLDRFAAGEAYANCDGSSGTPALTANDFQCFLNRFAEGCP
jgi:hypothetical protein